MIASAYLSRKVSIEPSLAGTAVLDLDDRKLVVSPGHSGSPVRACLRVDRRPQRASGDPLQLASRRGILWVGHWPVRVYLESAVWSDSESVLGLRPSNLHWPVGTARYARAGVAILEELGERLTSVDCATRTESGPPPVLAPLAAA
jgi:hypothetical protein